MIPKCGKTDTNQESHSRISTVFVIFMLGINCVKSNNLYRNLCGSTEKEEIVSREIKERGGSRIGLEASIRFLYGNGKKHQKE